MTPLSDLEKVLCEVALRDLVQGSAGVEYALLASPDGFEVARVTRARPLNGSRVAAMASSVFAVGSAMAGELRLGECRNLVVETDQGYLVLLTVPCRRAPLVLWTVARQGTTLGMMLTATRACTRELARQLDRDSPARMKTPQVTE
jgi:predicted regulator of Ras-like GTPase activity (Roadblock/LC7/MglB family)